MPTLRLKGPDQRPAFYRWSAEERAEVLRRIEGAARGERGKILEKLGLQSSHIYYWRKLLKGEKAKRRARSKNRAAKRKVQARRKRSETPVDAGDESTPGID